MYKEFEARLGNTIYCISEIIKDRNYCSFSYFSNSTSFHSINGTRLPLVETTDSSRIAGSHRLTKERLTIPGDFQ
jgi:hypothetical protein